jgi:predicted esterase
VVDKKLCLLILILTLSLLVVGCSQTNSGQASFKRDLPTTFSFETFLHAPETNIGPIDPTLEGHFIFTNVNDDTIRDVVNGVTCQINGATGVKDGLKFDGRDDYVDCGRVQFTGGADYVIYYDFTINKFPKRGMATIGSSEGVRGFRRHSIKFKNYGKRGFVSALTSPNGHSRRMANYWGDQFVSGTRHKVALVRSGIETKLYVDGEIVSSFSSRTRGVIHNDKRKTPKFMFGAVDGGQGRTKNHAAITLHEAKFFTGGVDAVTGKSMTSLSHVPPLEKSGVEDRGALIERDTILDSSEKKISCKIKHACPQEYVCNKKAYCVPDRTREVDSFEVKENLLFEYHSNYDLDEISSDVERVIIVFHGFSMNPTSYYDVIKDAISLSTQKIAIIAPSFRAAENKVEGQIYWRRRGSWTAGSTQQESSWISSYEVIDQLQDKISRAFPSNKKVIFVGHSAGGQFVQRYLGSSIKDSDNKIRYIVSNPGSYMFLNEKRKNPSGPGYVVPNGCSGYNKYKYGLDSPYRYLRDRGTSQNIVRRYINKEVHYLLGDADTIISPTAFDDGCQANLQGLHRFARGNSFFDHVNTFYPAHKGQLHIVPGVGHTSSIFKNDKGVDLLLS